MNGGTISNPTDASVNDVDGVYVGYEGKFFMNGGTISNNQRYGVNVTGSSQGSGQGEVTMTGGTITGNGNSGVRVINGNTLTVSGSPIITGNNGVNVDLSDGKIIVLATSATPRKSRDRHRTPPTAHSLRNRPRV